jgi:hypothetical protein
MFPQFLTQPFFQARLDPNQSGLTELYLEGIVQFGLKALTPDLLYLLFFWAIVVIVLSILSVMAVMAVSLICHIFAKFERH